MSRIDSSIRLSIIPLNNDSSSALYALKKKILSRLHPFHPAGRYVYPYLPPETSHDLPLVDPAIYPNYYQVDPKITLHNNKCIISAQQGCGYYAPRRSGCTPITSVNWLSGQTSLPSLLPSVMLWSEYIREVPLPPYPFRIHRWATNPVGFFSLDSALKMENVPLRCASIWGLGRFVALG